jgi:hypothetical protein
VLEELRLRLLPRDPLPPHELAHNPPPSRTAARIVGYLNPPPVMEKPKTLPTSSRRLRRLEAVGAEGVADVGDKSERAVASKRRTRLEQRRGR